MKMIFNNYISVFTLCLLVVIQIAVTTTKSTKYVPRNEEEQYILRLLENNRNVIIYGDKENGIDILDPLKLEDFTKRDESPITGYATFTDLVVTGLRHFEVIDVRIDKSKKKFFFKLYLKTLTMAGNYDTNMRVPIIGHIFGKGKFKCWVSSAWISADGVLSEATGWLQISSTTFKMDYKDFGAIFENINGGKLKNAIITSAAKIAYHRFKKDILAGVAKLCQTEINNQFEDDDIHSLADFKKHLDTVLN